MTTETLNVEIIRDEEGVKITEYSRTLAALDALEEKHKGVVFEVSTTAGMKEAKAARKQLRDLRVALEKKRKDLKAPVLDYTRALDGQAKTITARIEALENPIDEQVKAEEQRKAREKAEAEAAERARIDAHRQVIEAIRNKPLAMIGKPAVEIEREFHALQRQELSGFEEFQTEAALVKDEAAGKLHELWTQAMESEEAATKEAEAQRQREAKEAEEKAARSAELEELEELRRFRAQQEAKELEARRIAAAVPATDSEPKPEPVAAPEPDPAPQEAYFDVTVEWSGYSRGRSLYRVMAADASEAADRWAEGELVERTVVRDDTEGEVFLVEPSDALAAAGGV